MPTKQRVGMKKVRRKIEVQELHRETSEGTFLRPSMSHARSGEKLWIRCIESQAATRHRPRGLEHKAAEDPQRRHRW